VLQIRGRILLGLFALTLGAAPPAAVNPQSYLAHVRYLASPELKGRATGSPELEKAAGYIAAQYKSFGLKPADGKNFEEEFPVTVNAHLGPGNHFKFKEQGKASALEQGRDFTPFNFSSSGKLAGEVVFAGYGLTNTEAHYDDYEGLDAKDKIVLVLRHEPQESATKTAHASFAEKAVNANRVLVCPAGTV